MAGRICDAVAQGCDAVLLDLHGAMVTRSFDDGEGELLARIRRIAPEVPVGVALDMHTNLFPAMGRLATVIAGYQSYPHVDMYETGLRAGGPILSMLRKSSNPKLAFGIFDSSTWEYELIRSQYDIQTAADKIYAAKLPEELGNRLLYGM